RTRAIVELQRNADRMHVILPFARGNREAMPRHGFAGTFDAIAYLRPAVAIVLAQLAQQGGTLLVRQGPDIRPSHRGGGDWNPRTDVQLDAQRQPVAALTKVYHAVTVAAADGHRAAGRAHDFLAIGLGQMPNAEIGQRGIAERHGRWRKLILLEPRNRCKVAEL